MKKLRHKSWLYITLALSILLFIAIFLPLSSKEHTSYCALPPKFKTRYSIFEKKSYDKAETEYSSPGSETVDCAGIVTKLKLYIL
jgi:hypothetical protein